MAVKIVIGDLMNRIAVSYTLTTSKYPGNAKKTQVEHNNFLILDMKIFHDLK